MNPDNFTEAFLTLSGSICVHAEEVLGTDTFLKITLEGATVNPGLIFDSKVLYINNEGFMKLCLSYKFPVCELRKDEWLDIYCDNFVDTHQDCREMIGVITSFQDIPWYVDFVKNNLQNKCQIEYHNGMLSL